MEGNREEEKVMEDGMEGNHEPCSMRILSGAGFGLESFAIASTFLVFSESRANQTG